MTVEGTIAKYKLLVERNQVESAEVLKKHMLKGTKYQGHPFLNTLKPLATTSPNNSAEAKKKKKEEEARRGNG